jgi:hypothetical protein
LECGSPAGAFPNAITSRTRLISEAYDVVVAPLELYATLAAGLFSGASIYINLVEHPARTQCGTALALAQFAPSYKRATLMQATLAATGFLAALAACLLGAGTRWLIGGILLGLVIPFTLIVILPTNRRLLSPALAKDSPAAAQLLDRWGKLHAVRSILSFSAFLVFLFSLSQRLH